MASFVTRVQTAMHRIGVARGNLAFLRQGEAGRLGATLGRFATQYRITPNAMTRARALGNATVEDCARALVGSLDQLTRDASFIRGFTPLDARRINPHLRVLAAECTAFVLAQPVSANIDAARHRFLAGGMGSGSFAGSAFAASTVADSRVLEATLHEVE